MSKIRPKEFNIITNRHNSYRSCGCYYCECKSDIGFNREYRKNRTRNKTIKHRKRYYENLMSEIA